MMTMTLFEVMVLLGLALIALELALLISVAAYFTEVITKGFSLKLKEDDQPDFR